MSDPRWRLHKTVIDREREAANPPPFADTLTEGAANRLATTLVRLLQHAPSGAFAGSYFSTYRFLTYLVLHMGRHDEIDIGNGDDQRVTVSDSPPKIEKIVHQHVAGFVALSPDNLVRFLDWFAQFLVDEARLAPDSRPIGGSRADAVQLVEAFVSAVVDAINKCLQHDNIVFRIQPDDQFTYAVRRLPSEALEKHAIQPALTLLRSNAIKEALEHYENALRHFTRGEDTEAVVQASHAVESTMKAVLRDKLQNNSCDTLPAAKLIEKISDPSVGVLPASYQALWNNLRAVLQGVPTIRNQQGGHGKPPGGTDPDAATAEYAVNVAGASVVFLVRQWKPA